MTNPEREVQLLAIIDALKNTISYQEKKLADELTPIRNSLAEYTKEYSEKCSPLKPGDEIEYTPSGANHPGIVRILQARCIEVPDRWEYEAKVLSVGNGREKQAVGNDIWIQLQRWQTPAKLNNSPE